MLTRALLLTIDAFRWSAARMAKLVLMLKEYPLEVWEKTVMKRWMAGGIDTAEAVIYRTERYLADLRAVVRYRIYYEAVTKPMKEQYRELRRTTSHQKKKAPHPTSPYDLP